MCKRIENGDSRKKISQNLRYAIYNRDACTCVYCGQQVVLGAHHSETTAAANLEHHTPWSKGGKDDETNLVTACAHCNMSRGNKTLREWTAENGMDLKAIQHESRNRRRRNINLTEGKALLAATKVARKAQREQREAA